MEEKTSQQNLNKAIEFLHNILVNQAKPDALAWLETKQKQILAEKSDSLYFMTFSMVSRYFSKNIISLSPTELKQADEIRKYWNPSHWTLTQVARAYLVLNYAKNNPKNFQQGLDKLFNAADMYELIALYQTLPLLPHPEKYLLHATNGIRNNMTSVIESISLNNPYPADHFNEIAWNQLILKCLFVDSPIEQIIGLRRRANAALALALINTAKERFSAGRPIKSELWCLLGFCTDQKTWSKLKSLAESKDAILQKGALLAADHCVLPEAKELLKNYPQKQALQDDLKKLREFEDHLIQ
jgi:hypothetical protein